MDLPEEILKILLAAAVGGAVGFEREFHDKAAGFRTLIFICVGAALYTLMSLRIAGDAGDPGRIASYIVAGIGFLGGGVIMRDGAQIKGITTAATVWLVAALGIGVALGAYPLVLVVTALSVIVLWALPVFERWVDRVYKERTYEVVSGTPETPAAVEAAFASHGLRVLWRTAARSGARRSWTWKAAGPLAGHEAVSARLLDDPAIEELKF